MSRWPAGAGRMQDVTAKSQAWGAPVVLACRRVEGSHPGLAQAEGVHPF